MGRRSSCCTASPAASPWGRHARPRLAIASSPSTCQATAARPRPTGLPRLAHRLLGTLAGIERASWLGYSLGGRAAHVALARPDRIDRLVLTRRRGSPTPRASGARQPTTPAQRRARGSSPSPTPSDGAAAVRDATPPHPDLLTRERALRLRTSRPVRHRAWGAPGAAVGPPARPPHALVVAGETSSVPRHRSGHDGASPRRPRRGHSRRRRRQNPVPFRAWSSVSPDGRTGGRRP